MPSPPRPFAPASPHIPSCLPPSQGEIPSLYAPDELENIYAELRPLAREHERDSSTAALWAWFVERCRMHVHVVLCMSARSAASSTPARAVQQPGSSAARCHLTPARRARRRRSPIGDALRTRLRQFPSLINCTTIDWFDKWPPDALRAVAHHKLATVSARPPPRQPSPAPPTIARTRPCL